VLLWVSVGTNVLLFVLFWQSLRLIQTPSISLGVPHRTVVAPAVARTNVVIRRQNFVWQQLESEDYAVYIANLRTIGCPEATIRDIIVADVNQLYARRRATEVLTPQQQWWKSEPDPEVARTAAEKILALDRERRTLLSRLLGPEWESSDYPNPEAYAATPLDGPVLGSLSAAARQRVQQIERASVQRQQDYLEAQERAGLAADPAVLARLRKQERDELSRVLNREQLEEFLLRYSDTAAALRSQLRGLETSPEEFRRLFRRLDSVDTEVQSLGETSESAARRRDLLELREATLQEALGTERYQEYQLNQDPLYRQARSLLTQTGASTDKLVPLAAILRLSEQEEQRIRADESLSTDERLALLTAARLAQRNSLRRLLGEEAYQRYTEQDLR